MRRTAIVAALAFMVVACGAGVSWADKVVLVAGGGKSLADEGPATEAALHEPFAVDFDADRNMYICELEGGRVLKVTPQGRIARLAGKAEKGDAGDGGPAKDAVFNGMHHLLTGPDGSLLLADTWNNRVRRFDLKKGTVTALAGTGKKGFSGDGGPALKAEFGGIYCLALSPNKETLYLVDLDNRRLRAVNLKSGQASTVAGNGQKGVPADGAKASEAPLVDPRAVAVDSKGRIYILERSGNALRVVDDTGTIRTVAGTGEAGFSGDGGPALEARLNGPKHLSVDADDNVLIADTESHVIRKYLPKEGTIVRVAGTGKLGARGLGGPPLELELARPHGVLVGPDGAIYISDSSNGRIVKIVR